MTGQATKRAKRFLEQVLPAGGLEATLEEPSGLESMAETAELPSAQRTVVRTTLEKLQTGKELSPTEEFALEAIIIPDKRPAVDVVDGDFDVRHQLWLHYGTDPIRGRIRAALPSIGRVEVSGIPNLPYAGTGFVVGPGILMTNRHVAGLFASGLGLQELAFRSGIRAGIDFKRERGRNQKQFLRVRRVLMIHPYWDMALLRVDGLSERNPPLVLSLDRPEQMVGRDIAVIGYPAFDPRNPADVQNSVFGNVYYVKRLQPGKLGARRAVRSFEHTVSAMTHDASTLGGNSGSAVLDVASGNIVALHFAGVYLDANFTVPAWELSRDQRVIDSGVQFRGTATGDADATEEWWEAVEAPPAAITRTGAASSSDSRPQSVIAAGGVATWTIPIEVTVRVGADATLATATVSTSAPTDDTEKMVIPTHDPDYSTRDGYSEDFLGIDVPLPEPVDETLCAPLLEEDGKVLRYHHFSLVMHKDRRLAMFAASNFDGDPQRKKPESGRSYTRKALGGLGKNDVELWLTDSRVAAEHQLPDRFFTKDKGAFDRGHVVRREDVAWGDSYAEVQFANGDTFHTTNCSPQVAGFNQPRSLENWGDLEKFVSAQSGTDRVSVFAGPVLADDDPIFVGVDQDGPVRVQIPQQYWKVIVANDGGELRAFAFLLQQDLSDVPLEFAVDAAWSEHMLGIGELEELLGHVRFPDVVREADQADTDDGEAVRSMANVDRAVMRARPVSARRRPGIEREIPTPNSGDDSYAEPGLDRSTPPGTDLETVTPWRVAKSLLTLRRQVNERAPNRSKASDGTIGDAAHATRNSDHNPWVMEGGTGVVTAMDVTHDPANGCDADQLAEAIRAGRDRRVKYLIWNRRIASAAPIDGAVAWTWRPYGGANPHANHLHVSVQPDAAAYDSELPWAI